MSSKPSSFRPSRFLAARFWPVWILFGTMWLGARLPLPLQLWLGRKLGDTVYLLHRGRRQIVRTNLALCFPEKSADDRQRLLRECCRSFGMGLFELASLWFRERDFLLRYCDIEGVEYLHAARRRGVGVILLQAHFTSLELGASLIATQVPMDATYDPPKNPLFAAFLVSQRKKYVENAIENHNIRQMVRRLREAGCVWYSSDQHVRRSAGGVATTFFGHDVLTINGASRMAKMTGAEIIPYLSVRISGSSRYRLTVFPPLQDFPGKSSIEDTQRINDIMESQIRDYPGQYFWFHKRFKRTDKSQADLYE